MTTCRTCKSDRLYLFLPLGDHPLANGFLREEQLGEPEARFPLEVHVCLDCGLIQVADQVPAEYFRHYVYIPSAAEAMHGHFAGLAGSLEDGSSALRTRSRSTSAATTGSSSRSSTHGAPGRSGSTLRGTSPSLRAKRASRSSPSTSRPSCASDPRGTRPAKIVVSTNTFHHIGDLDPFTLGVTVLLDDDGVFVVEVPHALELVEQNEFDGVYHEHVSQHTVKSFVDHFRLFGLEVFDVERLDIHGGSIRVFGRRARNGATPEPVVREWLDEEARRGLFVEATYDAFRERVERIRAELLRILADLKADGKRIVGYGASARGNTLLNYYGIGTETLDYIVDRNPLKQGSTHPECTSRSRGRCGSPRTIRTTCS